MTYYKVTPFGDNKPIYHILSDNNTVHQTKYFLVEDELFTPCERARIANNSAHFEVVTISKKDIHFCFGMRFQKGTYPPINGTKYRTSSTGKLEVVYKR